MRRESVREKSGKKRRKGKQRRGKGDRGECRQGWGEAERMERKASNSECGWAETWEGEEMRRGRKQREESSGREKVDKRDGAISTLINTHLDEVGTSPAHLFYQQTGHTNMLLRRRGLLARPQNTPCPTTATVNNTNLNTVLVLLHLPCGDSWLESMKRRCGAGAVHFHLWE